MELEQEIITRVERDLRCYPDWIVRIEVGGLGIPSREMATAGSSTPSLVSMVEREAELSDEIKRKVVAIEKVYDRLHGKMKDLVEYRYFQGYSRDEVISLLKTRKWRFYSLRDRVVECFARALGYIE